MKKWLAILMIFVIIVVMIVLYKYNEYKKQMIEVQELNKQYETFTENEILGTSLITLINKAMDMNKKNNISLNDNGVYISNNTNSINIEVKFTESEDIFPMERIEKLTSEEFIKHYGAMSFKCTNKKYHDKTNNISYLLFEQI